MLIIEVLGHSQHHSNEIKCIFDFTFNISNWQFDVPHLNMNWEVNIISDILIGIGSPLVTVTIYEFISAQSPHSMKGLILGMYYFICGVCQFITSIAVVPFSISQRLWVLSSRTGCLFGVLLFACVIGMIGLLAFIAAARWYKYRERDDRPYDQRFVIDYYERYLDQTHGDELSYTSESD